DCVLNRAQDLRRIAEKVGEIDVLLTQFSYANWVGGPHDVPLREEAAAEKLDWMRLQLETIRPKFCIPFASFVVFAHEENHYLHGRRNPVPGAVRPIESTGVQPVVLYPGDTWTVGKPHDSAAAIERYEQAWDPAQRPLLRSESVGWEEPGRARGQVRQAAGQTEQPGPSAGRCPVRHRRPAHGSADRPRPDRPVRPAARADAVNRTPRHPDELAVLGLHAPVRLG